MGREYVLVSKKSTASMFLGRRARSFEKYNTMVDKHCTLSSIRQVECFLVRKMVCFQLLPSLFLGTKDQRFVSKQSRTSFQEWKQTSFYSTYTAKHNKLPHFEKFYAKMPTQKTGKGMVSKSKILAQIFSPPKMERQHAVGARTRFLARCLFCKARNFPDIWSHYKSCKSMPEIGKIHCEEMYKDMLASAEKDWREFLERKFEPHSFRKRWENIVCPYCGNPCKNIYHSFVCASTPICRRETNKRIALWNGS